MKSFLTFLTTIIFIFLSYTMSAQNGSFNTRFNFASINCVDSTFFVDVEVQAKDAATEFRMSDQNYRFSFNRGAIAVYDIDIPPAEASITVDTEFLSGVVQEGTTVSFFDPHTLTGSVDTVVSYNVVLAGGDGFPIKEQVWTKVGRLSLRIIDFNQCPELIWHDSQPQNFPPTFISEKTTAGVLLPCAENIYSNYADCIGLNCLLPIELASFEGTANECSVDLTWKTLTEIDNDYFIVERSYDGQNYTKIAKIDGAGNSIEPIDYNFTDRGSGTINYYRLTQVDFDGNSETFDVLQVKTNCEKQLIGISELFPNPATGNDMITVKFMNQVQATNPKIVVTTIDGKMVYEQDVTLTDGLNVLEFNSQGLSAGVYLIQVTDTNWQSKTKKFAKID